MNCILSVLLMSPLLFSCSASRSFTVDWDKDRFLKDGKQFQFYSAGIHYFRVPSEYWADRMHKMRLAGMNTLQTYIAWNVHQPQESELNFAGMNNVTEYLSLAARMGLNVVLRPGPYICAEWKFGGFPYWLLKRPGIQLRVYNEPYITAIAEWFSILLPKIEPFLYKNGGPIIAVQVENEYAASGIGVCDHKYIQFLLEQYITYLGADVVYYTLDNTDVARLACGALPGLLKTIDFGPDKIPHVEFEMLRRFQAHGPLVNSEFWTGWYDSWGDPDHANVSATKVAVGLDEMIQLKASVNLYMFEGGTNFAYTNGAMTYGGYSVRVTSYDYDSPLTEAGDTTAKYWAIRNVMKKYVELPPEPVPPHSPKWSSPAIQLTRAVSLFANLATFSTCHAGKLPATMEQFNQSDGFILYKLQWSGVISNVSLFNVHDRAIVYIDKQRVGTIDRREALNGTIIVPVGLYKRSKEFTISISILVENMGRLNQGPDMDSDYKGLTKMVLIDGVNVNAESWTICPLPLGTINKHALLSAPQLNSTSETFTPTFFCANFSSQNTHDTFLDPRGWGKGVAFLNDRNLGRYWPATGSQVTLYIPGIFFNINNLICIFEIDYAYEKQSIQFINKPILGLGN